MTQSFLKITNTKKSNKEVIWTTIQALDTIKN